ncbi:hypothetical protein V5799_009367 [Amblyomma americanum]|uniref:Uncharacterized protein n=1 Tax=Amblyomma americanum TaxID=6943 RepID=A0AAQ4FAI6_AMBAM
MSRFQTPARFVFALRNLDNPEAALLSPTLAHCEDGVQLRSVLLHCSANSHGVPHIYGSLPRDCLRRT